MRRINAVFMFLVLILPSGVLIQGCDESSTPTGCPVYEVGAIEGTVRGGGVATQAQVRAIPAGEYDDTRFRTRTDSTGFYRMELLTGTYRIFVLPPDQGGSISYPGMDTVEVVPVVRRFDLNKGSVRVRVVVPAFCEGRSMLCVLSGVPLLQSA